MTLNYTEYFAQHIVTLFFKIWIKCSASRVYLDSSCFSSSLLSRSAHSPVWPASHERSLLLASLPSSCTPSFLHTVVKWSFAQIMFLFSLILSSRNKTHHYHRPAFLSSLTCVLSQTSQPCSFFRVLNLQASQSLQPWPLGYWFKNTVFSPVGQTQR